MILTPTLFNSHQNGNITNESDCVVGRFSVVVRNIDASQSLGENAFVGFKEQLADRLERQELHGERRQKQTTFETYVHC